MNDKAWLVGQPAGNIVRIFKDVEYVIQRFQEEHERAVYFNRLELDTSKATPKATLEEWVEKMDPYWTEIDRLRLLTHRRKNAR